MSDLGLMLLFTFAAGVCIPLGGWLASLERIHPQWLENEFRHFVMAFGGGVLLAAVTLVLLPQGMAMVEPPWLVVGLLWLGGAAFFALEHQLGQKQHNAPQLMAMLLDFVPESLALGGMFIAEPSAGPLLAVLIGLQNLPEGFNAYREMVAKGYQPSKVISGMALMAALGPLMGWLGWTVFAPHEAVLGGLMLFASGGLLYLIFQDIAPQALLRRHWFPALGAVTGFSVALLGQLVLGG